MSIISTTALDLHVMLVIIGCRCSGEAVPCAEGLHCIQEREPLHNDYVKLIYRYLVTNNQLHIPNLHLTHLTRRYVDR